MTSNLRLCNSGADIHEVGSMRTRAQLLLMHLTDDETEAQSFNEKLCKLENDTVNFFKKKFGYIGDDYR